MSGEVTPLAAGTPPPAQPQVDTNAIANAAATAAAESASKLIEKKATEIAEAKLKEIGKAFNNEPPVDPAKQFLEGFVANPGKAFAAVKELTKKEIKEEQESAQRYANTQRAVLNPILQEYPELSSDNKLKFVERLTNDFQRDENLSYADALKKGAEAAVKELGLKSVSERQKAGDYRAVGLPGGGGMGAGAPRFDEEKSTNSFLTGMRNRMKSTRSKRTSA